MYGVTFCAISYLMLNTFFFCLMMLAALNTCARIENTGLPGRVHLSQEVADLLSRDGKAVWFEPRKDTVTAKGKGELHTYWLVTTATGRSVRGGLRDDCSAHNTEDSMTDLEDIDCLRLNSAQDFTSDRVERGETCEDLETDRCSPRIYLPQSGR